MEPMMALWKSQVNTMVNFWTTWWKMYINGLEQMVNNVNRQNSDLPGGGT